MNLTALQTKITSDFSYNLQTLESLILKCNPGSFILAPELALTGYSYDKMQAAVNFSEKAIEQLLELSHDRTISLTLMTKNNDAFYNTLFIFHKKQIVHTQSKHKIFVLNDERKYFTPGKLEDIKIVDIEGLKVGVLICFELRFVELWKQLQGADLILVPAYWGINRKQNYETLTQALAVANQCFVIASGCANEECAKSSAIISPFGNTYRDDDKALLSMNVNLEEIKNMRSHLYVGIDYE